MYEACLLHENKEGENIPYSWSKIFNYNISRQIYQATWSLTRDNFKVVHFDNTFNIALFNDLVKRATIKNVS